ncbi:MAG: hypothetical protein ACO23V_10350 [Chitinophagaceae bacterium]
MISHTFLDFQKIMHPLSNLHKYSILSAFIFLLGGCASTFTPDFGQMSAKYANSLEQYQINMIFQNILRASENRPISFLEMPTINGSGSIGIAPSVSGFFTGGGTNVIKGGLTTATIGTSLILNNNFNFTQSSLDNSVFWKGYLSELPINTVKYFSHSHIPKEVILSLAVDEFKIIQPDGSSTVLINNPLMPGHEQFQQYLYRLISDGLSAELIDTSEVLGLPLTMDKVLEKFGYKVFQASKDSDIKINRVGDSKTPLYQPILVSSKYKLCISSDQYANFLSTTKYSETLYCQEDSAENLKKISATKKKQPTLIVRIRSAYNIFEYLGQVVKAQLAEKPYLVTLPPSSTTFNNNRGKINQYALLVVNKDNSGSNSFAAIETLDGNTYSIPIDDSGYSTLSIKLLAQLLSLLKIPGSIPPSPSVLIR